MHASVSVATIVAASSGLTKRNESRRRIRKHKAKIGGALPKQHAPVLGRTLGLAAQPAVAALGSWRLAVATR